MKNFFIGVLSILGVVLCLVGALSVDAETYASDFTSQLGNWRDMVGKSTRQLNQGQFSIANQQVGTSFENIALNADAGSRSAGDVALTFVYKGQANFGLVFRAGANQTTNYQSFAYTRDGQWQFGQPGGKWMTGIKSDPLVVGQTYRLLVRYQGLSVQAYLNGKLIYDNPKVIYPDGSQINGEWSGSVGLRLFGNLSQLSVFSLKTGDVGELPLEINPEQFTMMQEKWRNQLVSDVYDETNPAMVKYVSNLSEKTEKLYREMNLSVGRTNLWPLKAGDTSSANLTTHFSNLFTLAQAYGTKGSSLYHDEQLFAAIEDGLDFMVGKKGYDGKKYYGNWWDWQVGVPQKFIGTLMILADKVDETRLAGYTAALRGYLPNPYQQLYTKPQDVFVDLAFIPNFSTTGANRTDLALSVLGLGILQQQECLVELASSSVKDVFEKVSKGDGFYADGSFVQHNNIPYTGSYGNVLMKGVGQILSLTKGSQFEMNAQTVEDFVSTVEEAFLPLINQGAMIPGVNGRSISRAPTATQVGFGSTTMYNLLIVSNLAPEASQKKLREAVKHWMLENPDYYLNNTRDYNDLQMTMDVMADSSVTGAELPFVGAKMFASMDRFVQQTPNYMTSLSLYSNRMSSFEAGNGENKRGWHTADGMFYLFNNDGVQFGASYWPTVDPYRLPGTTVDTVPLADEVSAFTTVTSPEKWVGGVASGQEAVVGMALDKKGTKNNGVVLPIDLRAKKSWFAVDGMTIALGAGITGTTKANIETVVDNRLLNDAYQYKIFTDKDVSDKKWIFLHSDQDKGSIGYYFPDGEQVEMMSEKRSGSYSEINSAFQSDKVYTGNYEKLIINHGQNPVNADYAYVTVPGANQEMMMNFDKKNALKILSNTGSVQAVELADRGYLGVNFWSASGGSVVGITADKAMSLMKQVKKGNTIYTIADPTQSAGVVHVKLPMDVTEVVSLDEGMTFDAATGTLAIDFTGSLGAGKQLVLK